MAQETIKEKLAGHDENMAGIDTCPGCGGSLDHTGKCTTPSRHDPVMLEGTNDSF